MSRPAEPVQPTEQSRRRLILIFGGVSSEHAVSVRGARSVAPAVAALEGFEPWLAYQTRDGGFRAQPIPSAAASGELLDELLQPGAPGTAVGDLFRRDDLVFPLLHGPQGEDGGIQGFLEVLGCRYVGSGVLASALCMDKVAFKRQIVGLPWPQERRPRGLAVLPCYEIDLRQGEVDEATLEAIAAEIGFPCFVKPVNMGSSVGISRVDQAGDLGQAIESAGAHDHRVLVERGLCNPREIELAVLGNGEASTLVSPPGEIVLPEGRWYDYEAKYESDVVRLDVPAQVDTDLESELQTAALAAFRACGCRGLARIDFMIDGNDGSLWLNEINTLPGFTDVSMYAMMIAAAGIDFAGLVRRLVELADNPA